MLEDTQALQHFGINAVQTIQTTGEGSKRLFSFRNTFRGLNKSHKLSKTNGDLQIIHQK